MWFASYLLEAVAIIGGTVHSLEPDVAPRIADVLVEDGRIVAIGADLEIPAGARRIDARGAHVVPGLIDALANIDARHDPLWISHGVTFVADVGADLEVALALREPAARDRTPGPAFATAGAVLGGEPPASAGALIVRGASDLEFLVPGLLERGVDYFAVQPNLSTAAYGAVLDAAREHGVAVVGPLPEAVDLASAVQRGHTVVHFLDAFLPRGERGERLPWPMVLPRALRTAVPAVVEARAGVVPMLAMTRTRLETPEGKLADFELLAPHYAVWWGQEWAGRQRTFDRTVREDGERVLAKQMDLVRHLVEKGARVIPGSGAPHPWLLPGRALHRELALWVEAGIAPTVVLEHATRVAAEVLGESERRGTITVGKIADLLVVDEDPRERLGSLASPRVVVVRGRVLERRTLDELVETLRLEEAERRELDRKPLEIDPPGLPEGAAPLLAGMVESRVLGQRVSGERWAIAREVNGETLFVGRLVRVDVEGGPGAELHVQQRVRDGRLVAFAVRLISGDDELTATGALVGDTLNVRRDFNRQHVSTESTMEPIAAIAIGNLGGSVTTPLVLGQRPRQGRVVVLVLGQGFEAAAMEWEVVDRAESRLVRTHVGAMVVEYAKNGAPTAWAEEMGHAQVATLPVESTSFGGPGLPAKRDPEAGERYIDEVRQRAERARREAAPAGDSR